jgi:hypothetical protein
VRVGTVELFCNESYIAYLRSCRIVTLVVVARAGLSILFGVDNSQYRRISHKQVPCCLTDSTPCGN